MRRITCLAVTAATLAIAACSAEPAEENIAGANETLDLNAAGIEANVAEPAADNVAAPAPADRTAPVPEPRETPARSAVRPPASPPPPPPPPAPKAEPSAPATPECTAEHRAAGHC